MDINSALPLADGSFYDTPPKEEDVNIAFEILHEVTDGDKGTALKTVFSAARFYKSTYATNEIRGSADSCTPKSKG